jgi:fluoroquinolone transport system permease protein
MSGRLVALVRHDMRLQARYGIYLAYGFVIGFYVVVLVGLGALLPSWAIGLLLYSDPAAVGFFFLGALMMLEKGEGVRTALAAAPMGAADYLIGKAVTLTGLSLLAALIIVLAVHPGADLGLLLVGQALTSVSFIGLGVPLALRFRTVNGYLVGAGAALTPFLVPAALALLEPMPLWALLWPPAAQLRLILVATGHGVATPLEIGLMLLSALVFACVTTAVALGALRRELGK